MKADDLQAVDRQAGRVERLTYLWFEVGLMFRSTNGATIVQTFDWCQPDDGPSELHLREVRIDSNLPGATARVVQGGS